VASRLIPAGLFLYAYFCAKTGNWGNGLILAGIASVIVFYNFPALAHKAVRIGIGVIIPLFFLWIALGVPGVGGEWWIAPLFYALAGTITFFSHRALACQLARRFLFVFRGNMKQSA
jgi:hypothetical protein